MAFRLSSVKRLSNHVAAYNPFHPSYKFISNAEYETEEIHLKVLPDLHQFLFS